RTRLEADVAVAVTGIAGPGGSTPEKPVGLVYLHAAGPDGSLARQLDLPGDRQAIRARSTVAALHLVRMLLARSRDESVWALLLASRAMSAFACSVRYGFPSGRSTGSWHGSARRWPGYRACGTFRARTCISRW